ncbi:MAG TPA: DinB family protein [Phycisphaerae bacterium]|jgi:hypothetical protein|nr:DinB family protein [Phycisphaerae bacterium]
MQASHLQRPGGDEYAPPFGKYVALVPPGDALAFLGAQLAELEALLRGMSDAEAMTVHAPYAWTLKQVAGHLTDCERVFGYRALRIARGDATPLPSFDENAFMAASNFNRWPIEELLREFALVRRGHIALFEHLEDAAWTRRGVVSGHPASARAFLYVMGGHARHHIGILHQRLGR